MPSKLSAGCKKCQKIKSQIDKHPESSRLQSDLKAHYSMSHGQRASKPKRNNKGCPVCQRLKAEVEEHPEERVNQDALMAHYKSAHKLYDRWYQ
jgi:hypothetical protein